MGADNERRSPRRLIVSARVKAKSPAHASPQHLIALFVIACSLFLANPTPVESKSAAAPLKKAPHASSSARTGRATKSAPAPLPSTAKATISTPASLPSTAKAASKYADAYKVGTPEFLWKVTSDQGTAYLVGTLHMVKGSFYPLPAEMETAFHQSKYLVLEIDLSKADPAVLQKLVASQGMYAPNGTDSLAKHLTKESRTALTAYLAKLGLPAGAFDRLKPWLVALSITKGELQKMGFQPELGIDQHFLHEAKATEKKVLGLESEEFQIKLLSGFPDSLQDEMLRLTLFEANELKSVADDMMARWRAGDEKGMNEVLTKDVRKHPELMAVQEKMIYDRNITMTGKIEDMLKTGDTYFVAVGSGHMVGERGIVALLKQKGYAVEQIKVGQALPQPKRQEDASISTSPPADSPINSEVKTSQPAVRSEPNWLTP